MRLFLKPAALFVFISLLTFTSCDKDKTEDTTEEQITCFYSSDNYSAITNPSFTESGIIPMNLSNFWKYADSTWDDSGNLIESDEFIIQVNSVGTYHDEVWWRTNFYPIQNIRFSGDSIYDLQSGLGECSFKNGAYFLFNADSISTTTGIWGDVNTTVEAKKVTSISTPAGTFSDCFYYHKRGYDATSIKPGIGILEWSAGFEDGALGGRKLTLIEYYIQ